MVSHPISAFISRDSRVRRRRRQFDTGTAVGRLLLNLLAAVAEFELEMIRERVNAGWLEPGPRASISGGPNVRP